MIKKVSTYLFLFIINIGFAFAQDEVYMFSYFTGNGEDGLHLAYSNDGLTWTSLKNDESFLTPVVGISKLMRDPSIVQGPDGQFHMVWTAGWTEQGIGYAWSEDLINWSEQSYIPVMEHEPEAVNTWAPELFYHEESKLFYILWATTIPGRHTPIGVDEKAGGKNHRMYYVTTHDFKTFSETRMFFNPDFSVIDAAIIREGNQYVMFLKNENPNPPEKNIRVLKSDNIEHWDKDMVSDPITGEYWAEGPSPLRVGEYVYVYFDKYRERRYGAVRTQDYKNWEDVSDIVSFPQGARHGTMFTVKQSLLERLLNL